MSEIERTLREIEELGMTTIIVEQNAIACLQLADRAIILDMGQVEVFDGTAAEVLGHAPAGVPGALTTRTAPWRRMRRGGSSGGARERGGR